MSLPRSLSLLVLAGWMSVTACISEESLVDTVEQACFDVDPDLPYFCGEETRTDLIAGRHIDVGSVSVFNDEVNLYVEYRTSWGWRIEETHLAIGTTLDDIPMNRAGNPRVGHFAYHAEHHPSVRTYLYEISLEELEEAGYDVDPDDTLVVAAHAKVVRHHNHHHCRCRCHCDDEETAWGEGMDFPGHNWAMYFSHTIQPCEQQPGEGYTTYTQQLWGDSSAGDEPYEELDEHFEGAFPGGVMIGAEECGYKVRFTNTAAIRFYLTAGGGNFPLDGECLTNGGTPTTDPLICEDPEETSAGSLGGEVLALTLNLGIDQDDPDFCPSPIPLGTLIYVNEYNTGFDGKTVEEILQDANYFLSMLGDAGCSSPGDADYVAMLYQCLFDINHNFENGEVDLGYLVEP